MGKLMNGEWQTDDLITSGSSGEFKRPDSTFKETIAEDHAEFKPESRRYHLYVSFACPWANRTLIMRRLKNLEDHIGISVVHPEMLENGWSFSTDYRDTTGDLLHNKSYLYEIYQMADPKFTGRVTVPVLWDKKTDQIVNNESSEILRILNSAFNHITGNTTDFYPPELQTQIDEWNSLIYPTLNNGVYRCGFAKSQKAYDQAVEELFSTLDVLESHLKNNSFLAGNKLTEADIRLFVTLIRFDLVYYFHFKTNWKRIQDYPSLQSYLGSLYRRDEFKSTVHFDHIKRHYYYSQEAVNPSQIVPKGPDLEALVKRLEEG